MCGVNEMNFNFKHLGKPLALSSADKGRPKAIKTPH